MRVKKKTKKKKQNKTKPSVKMKITNDETYPMK